VRNVHATKPTIKKLLLRAIMLRVGTRVAPTQNREDKI
jgi:hypothetical protein